MEANKLEKQPVEFLERKMFCRFFFWKLQIEIIFTEHSTRFLITS